MKRQNIKNHDTETIKIQNKENQANKQPFGDRSK